MKKKITFLSFLIFLLIHSVIFSQLRVNLTGGYQSDAGDFSGGFRHGYAFDGSFRFDAFKKNQWGFSTGFYRLYRPLQITINDNQTGRSINVNAKSIEQLQPIMIGLDHYLSNKRLRSYYGFEAGIYLTNYFIAVNDNRDVTIENVKDDTIINYGGAFTFGFLYDINDRIALDTRLKYGGLAYANGNYNSLLGISTGLSFVIGK